jgi:hypothetical protein
MTVGTGKWADDLKDGCEDDVTLIDTGLYISQYWEPSLQQWARKLVFVDGQSGNCLYLREVWLEGAGLDQ